jgi:hypothetical protein
MATLPHRRRVRRHNHIHRVPDMPVWVILLSLAVGLAIWGYLILAA